MILGKRTVELLDLDDLPTALREVADRVLVLGGPPCSAITLSASQPMLMAVGLNRATVLRRLCRRVARLGTTPLPAAAAQPRVSA